MLEQTKQEKKQTKGEAWQPKPKFDKKGNKEKEKDKEKEKQVLEENTLSNQSNNKEQDQVKVQKQANQGQEKKEIDEKKENIEQKALIISPSSNLALHQLLKCVEFLRALKIFIQDFKTPPQSQGFGKALDIQLDAVTNLISQFRSINEGMKTAQIFIRLLMTHLFNTKIDEQDQKDWLCSQIDQFVNQKIINASDLIIQNGSKIIQQNSSILVYARSYLVENLLINLHKKGIIMQIYIVDNPYFYEGRQLLEVLEKAGLQCTYLLLSHVSYIIKKVDKIFVGAHSMLNNGALISRVGTAMLACMAQVYRVPFHVFCESYKFSEVCQIDSLSWNELVLQQPNQGQIKYKEIGLMYDLTPSSQISMVVTEIGLIPPTSVKALVREFKKYNYVDRIEIPKKKNLVE